VHNTQNDATFGLTGIHEGNMTGTARKVKQNNSMHFSGADDRLRNHALYEQGPFGLSVDRIEKK
jgi:hypothetical protein